MPDDTYQPSQFVPDSTRSPLRVGYHTAALIATAENQQLAGDLLDSQIGDDSAIEAFALRLGPAYDRHQKAPRLRPTPETWVSEARPAIRRKRSLSEEIPPFAPFPPENGANILIGNKKRRKAMNTPTPTPSSDAVLVDIRELQEHLLAGEIRQRLFENRIEGLERKVRVQRLLLASLQKISDPDYEVPVAIGGYSQGDPAYSDALDGLDTSRVTEVGQSDDITSGGEDP